MSSFFAGPCARITCRIRAEKWSRRKRRIRRGAAHARRKISLVQCAAVCCVCAAHPRDARIVRESYGRCASNWCARALAAACARVSDLSCAADEEKRMGFAVADSLSGA